MPDFVEVSRLDLPELEPYRTLRRPLEHQASGIFVAEGGRVVRRMLEANIEVVSMLMTPEWQSRLQPAGSFPIYLAGRPLLETIVGFPLHQGIMAIGRIPPRLELQDVLQAAPHPWLLVALDGLEHAENVGVVARNAAAFGAHALIYDPTSSSPYLRRAVRNSMGAVFYMQVVQVPNLSLTLRSLNSDHSVSVLAADPEGELDLNDADMKRDLCIVLGNEGNGISDAVRQSASSRVSIPMKNNTDSLNVASASAVFLYAVHKGRRS